MKRLIILILLSVLVNYYGKSERIITNIDIARWYLDSDIVLICNVNQVDTIKISHQDSISEDTIHFRWDLIREKYQITVDSIIKTDLTEAKSCDTILTPAFVINYSKTRDLKKEFLGFDSKGDSIIQYSLAMFDDNSYDDSYFRLSLGKKHLVILAKTVNGYEIVFESECNDSILQLIGEIKAKGQSYIDDFFKIQ